MEIALMVVAVKNVAVRDISEAHHARGVEG